MQTVWIVYEYDYDDSRNRAVFDTLEKAEKFVAEEEAKCDGEPAIYRVCLSIETWEVR